MKYRIRLLTLSLLASGTAVAEEYQTFGTASYSELKSDEFEDISTVNIEGVYFFDKKQTLGPLSEFSFINTKSYILAGFSNSDPADIKNAYAGGKWIGDHIGLGATASFSESDESSGYDSATLTGEYLFSDKFLARINYTNFDEVPPGAEDSVWGADVVYDHSLNTTDYIGFRLSYNENSYSEDDTVELTSKYYNDFNNGQYLTATARVSQTGDSNTWSIGSTYYMSKATGIELEYTKTTPEYGSDTRVIEAGISHYFTTNFYTAAYYLDYEFGNTTSTNLDAYQYALEIGLQY